MLKLIPTIIAIINRTRVLKGSLSSRTTTKQMYVLLPAAAIVAAIGLLAPDILPEGAQEGVTLLIAGLLSASPWVMRLVGYKEPLKNPDIILLKVQDKNESGDRWHVVPPVFTVLDANAEGWAKGVTCGGKIIDLSTGEIIGEMPERTPDGNPLETFLGDGIGRRKK